MRAEASLLAVASWLLACSTPHGGASDSGGALPDAGPNIADASLPTDAGHSDAGPSDAGTPPPPPDGGFPIGWTRLADATTLQGHGFDHCPSNNFGGYGYAFDANCPAVYRAWTSGAFDPNSPDGPRFLIFGGGHSDYVGTEIYAVDVRREVMTRLTDPSPPSSSCTSVLSDGTPNISAHTYGMVAVVPDQNRLYVWARLTGTTGGMACGAFDLWALDLSSVYEGCAPCKPAWTQLHAPGLPTGESLVTAASFYNLGDHQLYLWEPFDDTNACSWSVFDPFAMTWTRLGGLGTNCTEYMSLVVDPVKQVSIALGSATSADPGGNFWMDISPGSAHAVHHPAVDSSCAGLANAASPALTWDSRRQQVVGYPGTGGAIYTVSVDTQAGTITCASESYGSTVGVDVPEDNNASGGAGEIFNKLHYDTPDDAYILSDNSDQPAWVLSRP